MSTKNFDFQAFQSMLQQSFHTSTTRKENLNNIQQHNKILVYPTELANKKFSHFQTTTTTFWPNISQADLAKKSYQQSGDRRILDEAVAPWERVLAHPGFATAQTDFRLTMLNETATSYFHRYWAVGTNEDLERALLCWLEAVKQAPPDFPDLPNYLNSLGNGFLERYAHHGHFDDLKYAIEAFEQAVQQTSIDSPVLPGYLSNLGNGLYTRYNHTGDFNDLLRAIQSFERAVQHANKGSPALSEYLNSLGNSLHERYIQREDMNDLMQAIHYYEQAVKHTSTDFPDLPHYLYQLGNGLYDRYIRTQELKDLQGIVEACEQAVQRTSQDSTTLPRYLSLLGKGLHERYICTQEANDLTKAIEAYERAIRLTADKSPDLPRYVQELNIVRRDRQIEDISQLIEAHKKKIQSISPDSPHFPKYLCKLGDGLRDRYVHTKKNSDLQEAIENYQQAAQKGLEVSVKEALVSATSWLSWAFYRQTWEEVEQAYCYAYPASEQVLNLQLLSQHDKEILLKDIQKLATQAAYALAKNQLLQAAVLAIERGNVRLFSEFLALDRTYLEQLKTSGHANLYRRYQQAVTNWQQALHLEPVQTHLQVAREELENTITDIRQVDGYAHFLVVPEFKDILAATKDTILVYLVTTQIGGVALIVYNNGEIIPVWLPEITEATLQQHILDDAVDDSSSSYITAYFGWREENETEMSASHTQWLNILAETTHWLWEAVMEPLIKILPSQAKMTLIPVGKLGLLPLHAAWTEDETTPMGKRYALDLLTIAYAPHAFAITRAHQIANQIVPDALLVIDELLPLKIKPSHTEHRNKTLVSMFDKQHQSPLRQNNTTHTAVLDALPKYNVLHIPCCGYANLAEPLESRLAITDDEFITLKELFTLQLKGVRLATLSACELDKLRMTLPDEIVNFSAGLLQAGIAGIVFSLWPTTHLSTTMLIAYFYDKWRIDKLEPIEALRQAQIWMRDTTHSEKQLYFQKRGTREDELMLAINATITKNAITQLSQSIPDNIEQRAFEHPFYWAGFEYVGV